MSREIMNAVEHLIVNLLAACVAVEIIADVHNI